MVRSVNQSILDSLAKAEKDNKGKKVKEAPRPYTEEGDFVFFKFLFRFP